MKLNRKWLNEEFVDLSERSRSKNLSETMTLRHGQKVETYERLDGGAHATWS